MDVLDKLCEALGEDEPRIPHPDCENCKYRSGDTCVRFRSCPEWREWFASEWNIIRESAERMRHNEKVR